MLFNQLKPKAVEEKSKKDVHHEDFEKLSLAEKREYLDFPFRNPAELPNGQKPTMEDAMYENFAEFSDRRLVLMLMTIIRDAIICDAYDEDNSAIETEIELATHIIYPIAFSIIFNTNFKVRDSDEEINKLIIYLVNNLTIKNY